MINPLHSTTLHSTTTRHNHHTSQHSTHATRRPTHTRLQPTRLSRWFCQDLCPSSWRPPGSQRLATTQPNNLIHALRVSPLSSLFVFSALLQQVGVGLVSPSFRSPITSTLPTVIAGRSFHFGSALPPTPRIHSILYWLSILVQLLAFALFCTVLS